MALTDHRLGRLLAPRTIAVLGGAPAERVVAQCHGLGFRGPIWPVHPRRTEIAGVPCVPSLADLPDAPDAVFLGVNRRLTVAAVAELASMGAGGAVCYGSGFAEAGDAALQHDLVTAAAGMPLLGPNCYGYVNTFDRVALWPDEHGCRRHERGAAIVSQSGNVAVNLTFQQRGLRLAAMVTVGNQATIGSDDVIGALLDDDRVTAIGMFIEAVRDSTVFAEVAIRALERGIPMVVVQTGRSRAGAAIAASHTGSMAGRAAAYDALFRRYGVATVSTPSELLETLKFADRVGRLPGPRVVSLSCSGGEASLVADRSEGTALRFEPFDDSHRDRIASTLTELVTISNPFDYHTFMWGDRAAMAATFTEVMDGPQDVTMLVLDAPPDPANDPSSWHVAADALADAADATRGRAVVVATLAECLNEPFRERLATRGVTALLGLGEALAALGAAALPVPVDPAPHLGATTPTRTRVVDEAAAKEWLRTRGVPVPDGVVTGRDRVLAAAAEVGYPVTLKALGIAHKSEAGAVHVGLRDEAELDLAVGSMGLAPGDGRFLVERTVTDVVAEVLVTVRRDPPVGWLVTIGHGGVTTEVWRDVAHLLAPVAERDVVAAFDTLRSAPLLRGFRGRPAADLASLARLVVRLASAATAADSGIVEIELNPVLVGRVGAVAVDALMTIDDAPTPAATVDHAHGEGLR